MAIEHLMNAGILNFTYLQHGSHGASSNSDRECLLSLEAVPKRENRGDSSAYFLERLCQSMA
jgi:hypothetical protein